MQRNLWDTGEKLGKFLLWFFLLVLLVGCLLLVLIGPTPLSTTEELTRLCSQNNGQACDLLVAQEHIKRDEERVSFAKKSLDEAKKKLLNLENLDASDAELVMARHNVEAQEILLRLNKADLKKSQDEYEMFKIIWTESHPNSIRRLLHFYVTP